MADPIQWYCGACSAKLSPLAVLADGPLPPCPDCGARSRSTIPNLTVTGDEGPVLSLNGSAGALAPPARHLRVVE